MYRRVITNMQPFNVYRTCHSGVHNKVHNKIHNKVHYGAYINTVMTGAEFKKIFPNHISCKAVGSNYNNYHDKYIKGPGLVVNDEEFNPSGDCSKGGLYFCDASKIGLYWEIYGRNIAMLELPDDARIYIQKSKCKTDRFVIQKILNIEEFFEELQAISHPSIINILEYDPLLIKYVKSPTEEMALTAVENDPKYFNSRDGYVLNNNTNRVLGYIGHKYQTLKICERAVEVDERNLEFAKIQTPAMCKSAIERDPRMLKYVMNPTDYLRDLARETPIPPIPPIKNNVSRINFKWEPIFSNFPMALKHDE